MINTINNFADMIKDIFTVGQNILPNEIKVIVLPLLTILVAVLVYKIIRKALI